MALMVKLLHKKGAMICMSPFSPSGMTKSIVHVSFVDTSGIKFGRSCDENRW